MTAVVIFIHVLLSLALILFVLMHSGQNSGLGSIGGGGGGASSGQHVRDRNMDRITVATAVAFVITTLVLAKIFT